MTTAIAQVANTASIKTAEFVKLVVATTNTTNTYTFSNAFKRETIDGTEYTALGGLVAVGNQQRDLTATAYDTSVALVGVDPTNINLVLNANLRGSLIEIRRGFYDDGGRLTATYPRFKGVVTTFQISEDREGDIDVFNVVINCSSYKTILQNNIGGRRTNRDVWNYLYNGADTSMDSVEKLSGAYFDFGVPVK